MAISPGTMPRSIPLLIASAIIAVAPAATVAQASCGSMAQCPAPPPFDTGLRQELNTAGLNALLGGFTAVATRLVQGDRDQLHQAFLHGAIGGGLTYAGKRVAVEGWDGAGLLGRELASVGGSVTRNAGAGRGALEELVLPVGPVRLYIADGRVTPRVDVATVIASAAFVAAYNARLDLRESLSAGAMIFRAGTPMPGLTSAGAIAVWDNGSMPGDEGPRLLAHERVHILQYDQAFLTLDEGLERWLVRRTTAPGRSTFLNHLDFGGLSLGLRSSLAFAVPYASRPWEREAYFLAQSAHPLPSGAALHSH